MKIFLYFLSIYFIYSCNNSEVKGIKKSIKVKENVKTNIYDTLVSNEELKIWDTIFNLPEVKSRIKYVDSITKGKRRLHISTSKKPDDKENFYWIQVSEDNGITTVTHFNFFVYPNKEIKYYDTVTDSVLTLEEWRNK